MDNKAITLSFECSKSWEDMKLAEGGRFCDSCKHVVHDLTQKSTEQIMAMRSQGKVCGMVRAEQLEPDLIPLNVDPLRPLKYAAATLLTFLGLELSQAKAQDVKKPAQTVRTNENGTPVDVVNKPVCPVGMDLSEPVAAEEPVVKNVKRKKILREP